MRLKLSREQSEAVLLTTFMIAAALLLPDSMEKKPFILNGGNFSLTEPAQVLV